MDDLAGADRGQVAIPLVGEDNAVRQDTLDAGGHGRGAAMGRFHEIRRKIVVGKDRAAHRRHADGTVGQAHLVQHFGDQAVRRAVRAAGAVVRGRIGKRQGAFIDQVLRSDHSHIYLYFATMESMRFNQARAGSSTMAGVSCATRWISPRISSGKGTTPPKRP